VRRVVSGDVTGAVASRCRTFQFLGVGLDLAAVRSGTAGEAGNGKSAVSRRRFGRGVSTVNLGQRLSKLYVLCVKIAHRYNKDLTQF
jgi:hypothetical protein